MATKCAAHVYLNAEPFGYGPSAMIADLYPYIRKLFAKVSYVGSGHTLDLQASLDYDTIHKLREDDDAAFRRVLHGCDLFVTSLHFGKAKLAVDLGIPTVVVDPLTWFWRSLPLVLQDPRLLYLAQGFHGVVERFTREHTSFCNFAVVPPLAKKAACSPRERGVFLVNFGGIQNPFWSLDDCGLYVETLLQALSQSPLLANADVVVLASKDIAAVHPGVTTLNRQEVLALLPAVKVALQCSGLGNIFDSAAYGIPTLFLPPPGDSHGQQLALLRRHHQADDALDWADIDPCLAVDYWQDQPEVFARLKHCLSLVQEKPLFAALQAKLNAGLTRVAGQPTTKLRALFQQFGSDGAADIAQRALAFYNANHSTKDDRHEQGDQPCLS